MPSRKLKEDPTTVRIGYDPGIDRDVYTHLGVVYSHGVVLQEVFDVPALPSYILLPAGGRLNRKLYYTHVPNRSS